MIRIKSPQDLGAGLMFMLVSMIGIVFGASLEFGSAGRMGPGYFPLVLSGLIGLIGVILAGRGLVYDGPPVSAIKLRPLLLVLLSIMSFVFLIEWLGLALTTAVLCVVATLARPDASLKETIVMVVVLSAMAVLLFPIALRLPIPILWTF